MYELATFRLRAATDEAAFLELDRRVQTGVAYQQPGLLRRTTARGDDGSWLVIQLWRSAADADRAEQAFAGSPLAAELDRVIDTSTLVVARYTGLD